MAVVLNPYIQYFTFNGLPRNGGKVYTYAAGTTTPKATFTTALGNIPAANPITLNSAGIPDHGSGNIGQIWIQGAYDFLVTNADGTDPVLVPNQISFNTVSAAGASYFQTFSGDGTTTTFPLSQPLGTDENAVYAFVDNGLQNYIVNGDFATDTIWTKGTGWTIGSGVATATGAISTAITQTASGTITPGQSYTISYTITQTAGSITPTIGGATGTARTVSGTYTETIIAGATQVLGFNTAGFTGTLDNVSVRPTVGQGRQYVYPTEYTLNNTSITFATAPKAGTNNIALSAPSTLVAAASASAAAAEAFANAANVSATASAASAVLASNYAAALTSTSVSSVAIGTGSQSFTTQTGKQYAAGQFISLVSNANPINFMHGNVTSYNTGTGALVVMVTDIGGGGTFADWNISVSGSQGSPGSVPAIAANSFLANQTAGSAVPSALALGVSQLAGRGSTGNLAPITLGAGLTMTGTTLSASGGQTFTSANQTITAAGGLTIPHGFGTVPFQVTAEMQCTTADAGYSVGDVIEIHLGAMYAGAGTGAFGVGIWKDAMNINVRFAQSAGMYYQNKTTGAIAALVNGSWVIRFKAVK